MNRFLSSACFICCILAIAICGSGCGGDVECMTPPSEIALQIADGSHIYPADLDTAETVKVFYVANNERKYMPEVRRMGDVFLSSMIIENSHSAGDPEFSFELNGRILAQMKMDTYVNKTKCSHWANISKVYQNGEVVSRSPDGAYVLR